MLSPSATVLVARTSVNFKIEELYLADVATSGDWVLVTRDHSPQWGHPQKLRCHCHCPLVSTSSLHQLALLTRHSNKLLTNCSITLLKPPSVKLFLFVFFRSFELNECFPDCVYSELYQWKFAHNNMTAIIVPFCVNFRLHLRCPGARGGRPRQE